MKLLSSFFILLSVLFFVSAVAISAVDPTNASTFTTTETPVTPTTTAPSDLLPLTIPPNLCVDDSMIAFSKFFQDSATQKTYFLSYDLCKPLALTACIFNSVSCGTNEFQIAQLNGLNYNKSYNNTQCGATFGNHSVLSRNSSLVVAKYFNFPAYQNGTVAEEFVQLTINCVPRSEFIVTIDVDINKISWTVNGDGKNQIYINTTGVCASEATDDTNGGGGKSAGVYIAIAVVLISVAAFASVLFKAKTAGDRLRKLKRARGEKAFLG